MLLHWLSWSQAVWAFLSTVLCSCQKFLQAFWDLGALFSPRASVEEVGQSRVSHAMGAASISSPSGLLAPCVQGSVALAQ